MDQKQQQHADDYSLYVFAVAIVEQEGILLSENNLSGRVYFSLDEIPLSTPLMTETNVTVERLGSDLFKIGDKQWTKAELDQIGTQHLKIKYQTDRRRRTLSNSMIETPNIIVAKSFEDLPDDLKKTISRKIDVQSLKNAEYFAALLNIIRFLEKVDFRPLEVRQEKKVVDKTISNFIVRLAESVLTVDPQAKKNFRSTEFAGKGGFGNVFFAEQTIPKKMSVAIKKVPHSSDKEKASNLLELGNLASCAHPNIVKLVHAYQIQQELWIVTEYMSGGTLSDALSVQKFSEGQIAFVAREVLKALQFLHYKQVMHRDLKSNIMLTVNGEVKLIDFGLAEDTSTGPRYSMCGSALWMSPEMIQGKPYSCPVDIWSFGIVAVEMITGKAPYEDKWTSMYKASTEGLHPWIHNLNTTPDLKDFLFKCLEQDQTKRWAAGDLLDHPLLKKADTRRDMEIVIANIFVHNMLVGTGLAF